MQSGRLAPGHVKRDPHLADQSTEMRRFHFSLESVLRLRAQQEQAAQVELARVMHQRVSIVHELDKSRAAEADLYEYLRQPGRTAAEMSHVASFGTLHRQRIFNLGVRLGQFDASVELLRTRHMQARARREALEKLREKQHAAWRADGARAEQDELDEIATMRAGRAIREARLVRAQADARALLDARREVTA